MMGKAHEDYTALRGLGDRITFSVGFATSRQDLARRERSRAPVSSASMAIATARITSRSTEPITAILLPIDSIQEFTLES